jgi:hypothetical protein
MRLGNYKAEQAAENIFRILCDCFGLAEANRRCSSVNAYLRSGPVGPLRPPLKPGEYIWHPEISPQGARGEVGEFHAHNIFRPYVQTRRKLEQPRAAGGPLKSYLPGGTRYRLLYPI